MMSYIHGGLYLENNHRSTLQTAFTETETRTQVDMNTRTQIF